MSSHSIKALIVACALGLLACGGSSSETPLPLPPHALHEAYRTKRVAARPEPSPEPASDAATEPRTPSNEPAGAPARSTWGGEAPRARPRPAPAPVPELE